jgi:hypothetical protein
MSPCGCKGKKTIVSPAQQPARITYVENGEIKSKPAPLPSTVVPAQEVENIVNKLNEITVP